ncbi:MAG: biosynthetic-type acetolactate synthase large subunit [Bacteroidetes bacterium]|uniref:Acetolactate synthase n=1 Tax=Candidatus Enterocola intestinipullorum TaxID=2840783 RepID=A0A9D9EE61_9BACT|nr:biosynthetic-type acetolactate synthase large subunit [Candidatus Enterocola intestinipullorum]
MSKTMKGSYALMESLLHENVDVIFGYPGGQIIPAFDALYDYKDRIRHILVRHEQGATHAAEGYADISGKPGVVLITSGPGATNAITGIADAMMDSRPMVVIAGQVSTSLLGTDAFQETDLVGVTQPITKWSYQIRSAQDVPWAVARAFYIAKSGRPGPVVLDFTINAQNEMMEYEPCTCDFIRSYVPVPDPDEEAVAAAAEMINNAEKPLVLVGHGVTIARAEKELLDMIEKAGLPAAWTMMGESAMPTDHPLNMGMLGMHGNIAPNRKTNECDVLIAVGMRFDNRITGDLNHYARQAKIIHFEIDPAEINKNVKSDVAVAGDVKVTLPMVTELLKQRGHKEWIDSFKPSAEEEFRTVIEADLHPDESRDITMPEVVRKVSDATGGEAVLVTDVGQNQMAAIRYFRFKRPRSVVTSGGSGTMGFGIPAAIGAKIAAPDRTVCLFCGDGGFQMTEQELGVIMQEQAGVKIIILNNSYLGMVRQWQELFYNKRYSYTPMINPDFEMIAKAYGIPSRTVNVRDELDAAVADMLKDDKPYVLVVNTEEDGMVYPMVPAGGKVTDILIGLGLRDN